MIKIGSAFLRKTNNKETMQIFRADLSYVTGLCQAFSIARRISLAVCFLPSKLKPRKTTTKKNKYMPVKTSKMLDSYGLPSFIRKLKHLKRAKRNEKTDMATNL